MIGLLLLSHGRLAQAFIDTAVEIVGPFESAEAMAVSRQEGLEEVEARMIAAIGRIDRGRGVLVLADMFGGTAANVALRLVGRYPIDVVTGASLPMLLKASSARRTITDRGALATILCSHGQQNISFASQMLREREQDA